MLTTRIFNSGTLVLSVERISKTYAQEAEKGVCLEINASCLARRPCQLIRGIGMRLNVDTQV